MLRDIGWRRRGWVGGMGGEGGGAGRRGGGAEIWPWKAGKPKHNVWVWSCVAHKALTGPDLLYKHRN